MNRFTTMLFLLLSFSAICNTIIVDKGGKIRSVRAAIQISEPGDTIIIKSGTYREGNIIIEKSLVIKGESYPVLDGENKFEIFTVHASGVTISGLKFVRTGVASIQDIAGVKILDSKFIRILDNRFD